jgi:hypothetical protein
MGAQPGLRRVSHDDCRVQLPPSAALGLHQQRHRDHRAGGKANAYQGRLRLTAIQQRPHRREPDPCGQGKERRRDQPQSQPLAGRPGNGRCRLPSVIDYGLTIANSGAGGLHRRQGDPLVPVEPS